MVQREEYDLVVIGGGSAGLVGARTAAGFGSKVLLIEKHLLGGDCLWTGCVPSKSLIAAASAVSTARGAGRFGVTAEVSVDFPAVMAHVHRAMDAIAPDDSPEALQADGVEVLMGRAVFDSDRSVNVDGRRIRFRQALIATGGSPTVPDLPGAGNVDILSSETFWDITELPERLVVLGGGAIGCEISQAMARLGSSVTMVHRGKRILAKEDEKAAALVTAALVADGVDIRLERSAVSFEGKSVTLDDGSVLEFDTVLAAIGRRSNTDGLGLERAGVRTDDRGNVVVDRQLRSSNPRIRAAGDVSGLPQFTHTAGVNGSLAATNMTLGLGRSTDVDAIPRITFTHPEVGAVGVQPSDAAKHGFQVVTIEHRDLDRAVCEGETEGYTSLVVDSRGRIRGGTIVGPRAGDSLGGVGVAVRNKLSTTDVANTTHAYPTFTDAVWKAAVADFRGRLGRGITGKATGVLRDIRSRRVR